MFAILAVLTVLVFTASTGQTRESSSTPSSTEIVQKYDRLVKKKNNVARKVLCTGTKAFLVKKRNATWGWQDAMLVPRTRTNYAERNTKCSPYLKWLAKLWGGRADQAFRSYVELREPQNAICHVFGNYCSEALTVARCESGHAYSVRAQNGQYLGMFQMGDYARSRYGHGYTPLSQAIAAYRYFVDSGRDWSPWSCKPWR